MVRAGIILAIMGKKRKRGAGQTRKQHKNERAAKFRVVKNSTTLANVHPMVFQHLLLTDVKFDGIGLQKIFEDATSLETMVTEEHSMAKAENS